MTRTVRLPIAQRSFAWSLEHVDLSARFIDQFAPRDQLVALLPR
jgi:hypothetical protein